MAPIVIWRYLASWGAAARWTGLAAGFWIVFWIVLAISLVTVPCSARADDAAPADPATPDKSGYTLLNPTPDDQMRKFAPDRPTKGFSVRTIDAGHVEVEMDTFNETYSRYLGVTTHNIQTFDPDVRIGVTNSTEFDIQFNGWQSSRLENGAAAMQGAGFGDVILRTKMNLFGNDDGPVGLAIIPYVKVPSSAPVISNGAVEGGLIVPLALRLPQDYLVTLMTEVDALKDDLNHREANFVNLVGVSHPIPGIEGANAMVELFSSVGADRATSPIYTFDLGMNFRLDKHTIVDVGLNLGLNNAAPKVQIYTGISARF